MMMIFFFPYTLEVLLKEAKKKSKKVAVFSGNMVTFQTDEKGVKHIKKIYKNRSFKDRYEFLLADTTLWPRFYRTDALRKVGGWPTNDPYCGRYVEDRQILLRLIENYEFHWIDKVLYKYRRHNSNQTKNTALIVEMMEWITYDTLRRWGNKYKPVFKTTDYGWKTIVKLIPQKESTNTKK